MAELHERVRDAIMTSLWYAFRRHDIEIPYPIRDVHIRQAAERIAQLMIRKRIHVKGSRILVMGLTFKENCPDVRNSKVADKTSTPSPGCPGPT